MGAVDFAGVRDVEGESKNESFQVDNSLLQQRFNFLRDFDIKTCQMSLSQ
jgi:hypothetical protein